jgi:hypothetical protein
VHHALLNRENFTAISEVWKNLLCKLHGLWHSRAS